MPTSAMLAVAEDRRGVTCRWTSVSRPTAIAYIVERRGRAAGAVARAPARTASRPGGFRARPWCASTRPPRAIARSARTRLTRRRARSSRWRTCGLHDLHLRLDRATQGRGDRARRASATSCGWPPRSTASGPSDRVYQGMTIAFDFSVEEIWVPWAAGATLVPEAGRVDACSGRTCTSSCRAADHRDVLRADAAGHHRGGSAGAAVPAGLRRGLPAGPDRPLVPPGRRFLNVYGPTEATVTATWTTVDPDRPVTIGVPLPTYSTVILDPRRPAPRPAARRDRRDRHRRDRAGRAGTSTATT